MFRPRVIPVLLLKNMGLVKSQKFKNHRYIGDPINAVRIFNDLNTDELVFLDILATKENRKISLDFVRNVGEEANMPFAVGGGICSVNDIKEIINAGAEKVVINSYAIKNPDFIKEASAEFGSSTIVVALDVKKNIFGKQQIYSNGGQTATGKDPVEFAQLMEKNGAGELIITSIEMEGTQQGYDLNLIRKVAEAVTIPVIANGGAGNTVHLKEAVNLSHASAVAASSMFLYHGSRNAVLLNYPTQKELQELFK